MNLFWKFITGQASKEYNFWLNERAKYLNNINQKVIENVEKGIELHKKLMEMKNEQTR